jgi:5-methylcytosine-specific restriction endonuclease McrA
MPPKQKAVKREPLTITKLKFLGSKQKWLCYICNQILDESLECDHLLSLENGGTNDLSNLCLIHASCHAKKTFFDRNPKLYEEVTGLSKYFGNGPLSVKK